VSALAALLPVAALPAAAPAGEPALPLGAGWSLALAALLIFLNGVFVAAEFSLVKVRPTQLEPRVQAGQRRARVARYMTKHLDSYLSATQLGVTLASLGLGWVGEPAFAWIVRPAVSALAPRAAGEAIVHTVALTLAFLLITMLHIVLGELAPKWIAIDKAETTVLWLAPPLFVFHRLTYPAIWVLNRAARGMLKLVGLPPPSEGEVAHDE